jgi:hypothetical protein
MGAEIMLQSVRSGEPKRQIAEAVRNHLPETRSCWRVCR